jgi:hypothetical protein
MADLLTPGRIDTRFNYVSHHGQFTTVHQPCKAVCACCRPTVHPAGRWAGGVGHGTAKLWQAGCSSSVLEDVQSPSCASRPSPYSTASCSSPYTSSPSASSMSWKRLAGMSTCGRAGRGGGGHVASCLPQRALLRSPAAYFPGSCQLSFAAHTTAARREAGRQAGRQAGRLAGWLAGWLASPAGKARWPTPRSPTHLIPAPCGGRGWIVHEQHGRGPVKGLLVPVQQVHQLHGMENEPVERGGEPRKEGGAADG